MIDRENHYLNVSKDKLDCFGDFKRELNKNMFIKKGGKAIHLMGDISRNCLNAELIYVYNETDVDWIGQYCEGFGYFDVKFNKKDCREATAEEIQLWSKDKENFKF